uniref:CBF1-interacting co-repressor CIR N-terminal domain-containing protein n=1 Tax=Pundamilia nyererei TaxID=303518 RepID=A0A3B4HCI8_9CICH
MGDGDLNLKKSWHPQTMKNIERVWKSEQKHKAEHKKIEELQKQLKEERAREEMTKYAEETGVLKKKDDRSSWRLHCASWVKAEGYCNSSNMAGQEDPVQRDSPRLGESRVHRSNYEQHQEDRRLS